MSKLGFTARLVTPTSDGPDAHLAYYQAVDPTSPWGEEFYQTTANKVGGITLDWVVDGQPVPPKVAGLVQTQLQSGGQVARIMSDALYQRGGGENDLAWQQVGEFYQQVGAEMMRAASQQ